MPHTGAYACSDTGTHIRTYSNAYARANFQSYIKPDLWTDGANEMATVAGTLDDEARPPEEHCCLPLTSGVLYWSKGRRTRPACLTHRKVG